MFLPPILPEELLAFYMRRVEHLNFGDRPRRASSNFLGLPSRRVDGWLPNFVDKVETILGPALGLTQRQIIQSHTLFPYFLSACSVGRAIALELRMTSRHAGPTRFCLALTDSEFRTLSFRFCRTCAARDLDTFGVAYAHRQHQLPYVHYCDEHGVALVVQLQEAGSPYGSTEVPPCEQGLRFTALSAIKLHCRSSHSLVIRKLGASGFILKSGRTRKKAILEALSEAWPDGFGDTHLDRWFASTAGQQLLRSSFHARQTSLHPVIGILFESICTTAQYQYQLKLRGPVRAGRPSAGALEALRESVAAGRSISQAAREGGVSFHTLQHFVGKAGDPVAFRPSLMTAERRSELLAQLRAHGNVAMAARAVGISLSSAYRVAWFHEQEIGMVRAATQKAAAAAKVKEWEQLAAKHPELGRKGLRNLKPALYAWLYRHAREVLNQTALLHAHRQPGARRARIAEGDLLEATSALRQSASTEARPYRGSAQKLATGVGVNTGSLRTAVTRQKRVLLNESLRDFHLRRLKWSFNQLLSTTQVVTPWRILKLAGLRTTTLAPYGHVVDTLMAEAYDWANPTLRLP